MNVLISEAVPILKWRPGLRTSDKRMCPVTGFDPTRNGKDYPLRVWLSRDYLAVEYLQPDGHRRLSVNRVATDRAGEWLDGITWDELQRVKRETVGDVWAVEAYPPEAELVNEHNLRHLFILGDAPDWAWREGRS